MADTTDWLLGVVAFILFLVHPKFYKIKKALKVNGISLDRKAF